MTKRSNTRREALLKILGAAATGAVLGKVEIAELLAQVKKVPDLTRLTKVGTTNNAVKALKVLLAPRGQRPRVFESEYGRKPALKVVTDRRTGRAACDAYLGHATAACVDLACDLVVCNGLGNDVVLAEGRQPRGPGDTAGGFNSVGGRTGSASGCTCAMYVPPTWGAKINPEWLRSLLDDPYIHGLLVEYGLGTAEALEAELTQALGERRAGR